MDHNVDPAEAFFHLAPRGFHVLKVADVAHHDHRACAQFAQPTQGANAHGVAVLWRGGSQIAVPGLWRGQGTPRQKRDPRAAFFHQPFGKRQSDTAEPAGDQADSAIGNRRFGLRKLDRPPGQFIALAPAQRRREVRRLSQQILDHQVGQPVHLRIPRGTGRQGHVERRTGHAGEFARDDAQRAEDGRLFGVRQRFVAQLLRAGRDAGQVQRAGQVRLSHRLGKEQEALETLFQIAHEEARPKSEGPLVGGQPEMRDAARCEPLGAQNLQQPIIVDTPAFG